MSTRRSSAYLVVLFFVIALTWVLAGSRLAIENGSEQDTVIPGRNVNMVSGIHLPGGDPWLQRQNEPSIAVSTRNPLHLLAGANDYRTVDMAFSEGNLPGKAQGAMAGDAWVGIYKSFDGGESWVTSLMPGFPQDQGSTSVLKQFSTAADPIVRAGTNGLFYYSGMAFNRAQEKGGGSIFLTRFIDNNNVEDLKNGDPIKYLGTKFIDLGTSGQFIDMPRIAVDIPRGSATMTIDGQTIPRSNVYCAYTVFLGNSDINVRSRILFRRSTDCGETWGSAIKVSESQHIIQGATFAIDPRNGAIYLAFRRFLHPSQTDSIVIVKSTDFGQTFSQPYVIANILPFDQPATDAGGDEVSDPAGPSFRSNSYPTMAVDNTGIVYIAWTERGRGPAGEARIVMSTSQDGSGWTSPTSMANASDIMNQGHQFMPSLSYAQGKLVLVWYDQRYDEYGSLYGVGQWIGDNMPIRHTTDVRCAQAAPGRYPNFEPSVQVSRYIWALKPGTDDEIEQQQYNPPNFEMFKGGTTPFHGDYIEVTAAPQFVLGPNGWAFNTEPSKSPVFHAVWTDNRDVRPPADGKWANYVPPASDQGVFGSIACGSAPPDVMGMRNQNIYTSTLVRGIAAASPGNSKTLGDLGQYYNSENGLIPRAFVIYVKNPSSEIKVFRLGIEPEPVDVDASFLEFEDLESLDVMIAPFSTVARTVFVRSSAAAYAAVSISVTEIDALDGAPVPDGLTASVLLNPDPTSPVYSPSDEFHDPTVPAPNIVNWDELNPNIVNPNIRNPNIRNYDEMNPNIVNPNIRNPNIVNPNIRNPNIVNPNIVNPNIRNYTEAEFDGAEIADVEFSIKNDGNTTSTYTLKTYSKESLPDAVYAQLLLYRVHYTPSADYYLQTADSCNLKEERHHELLLNITNPNIRNPNIVNPNIRNPNIRNGGLDNATFAVAPGEEVEAILRVIDFDPGTQGQYRTMQSGQTFSAQSFADSIGFAATAHAINTDEARTVEEEKLSPKTSATKLVISTSSLPYGIVGMPYDATLTADGGAGPYTWTLESGEFPPGLSLGADGLISGSPDTAGMYRFIVRVDDSDGDFDTQRFSIYVDANATADPLTITTASLPSGVLNHWYGATLEAEGGAWPLTWRLASGALPLGLSLDESGVISGTIQVDEIQDYPTTYDFTVIVTDGAGISSVPRPLSIYVNLWTGTMVSISGMVYSTGGTPLDGVVMRGLPNTPVTGTNGTPGYYEDRVPNLWSGTVTPFFAGQTFTPTNRHYSMVASDQANQDYSYTAVALESIAFNSNRDGNYEIYIMKADGSGQTRLTNNSASDTYPAFTPDGSKIAFMSMRDGNYEIYIMNADGSGQTRLTNNPASETFPAFSPDGSKIAFASNRDGNDEIYIMNADGSGQIRLTNNPGNDEGPIFSPDGSKIAFSNNQDTWDIYIMNADGSGQIRLTNNPGADFEPCFSPDGSKIAFASSMSGYSNWDIYVMNADGTGQIPLTFSPGYDGRPRYSPDGGKIVFYSTQDDNYEIYVMNADGSGQARLTNNPAQDDAGCYRQGMPLQSLQPNLLVEGISGNLSPGLASYTIVIRNSGLGTAPASTVGLKYTFDDGEGPPVTLDESDFPIPELAPGDSYTHGYALDLAIPHPMINTAYFLVATSDPLHVITETSEFDNDRSFIMYYPGVLGLSPPNGAVEVPTNTNLSIWFTETMFKGSGNIIIRLSSNPGFPWQSIDVQSSQVTITNNIVVIDPSDLNMDSEFQIEIPDGCFVDGYGNSWTGIGGDSGIHWVIHTIGPVNLQARILTGERARGK